MTFDRTQRETEHGYDAMFNATNVYYKAGLGGNFAAQLKRSFSVGSVLSLLISEH